MKNILHFLGPMCFEKITQVSIYFSNLVYSGNTVTYVILRLQDINVQSVVHSGTCQVTFTARDVGVSIRIRGG